MSLLSQFYNCGETSSSFGTGRVFSAPFVTQSDPTLIITSGIPVSTGGTGTITRDRTYAGYDVYDSFLLTNINIRLANTGGFFNGSSSSTGFSFKWIGHETSSGGGVPGAFFRVSAKVLTADFSEALMCDSGSCGLFPEGASTTTSCNTFVLGACKFHLGGFITVGTASVPVTNIDPTYWRVDTGSMAQQTNPLNITFTATDSPVTRESIDACIIKFRELIDQCKAGGFIGPVTATMDFSNNTAGNGGVANLSAEAAAARTYLIGLGATITV